MPKKATKPKAKKKPKVKKTVQQKQRQAQKQIVNVVIGSDSLKPRRKRKTKPRTAPAAAPVPQLQQTYMTPIYIPPTPVPIIRQRIRNQTDIQEQLRAYDRQQQDLIGANATAFEATNINKRVLYPVVAEPIAQEQEREPDPRITEQLIKEKAAEEQPQPLGKGRPRGDMKGRKELIQEIKGAGSIPRGAAVDKKSIEELREMAVNLGIDPLR